MNQESPAARGLAIEATRVSKSFPQAKGEPVRAVGNVSFSVASGDIVAVLGPNGAGKTTLFDMLLGLTQPDSGSVAVFGKRPERVVKDGIVGAVLQTGGLLPDVTVRDTVRMIAATFPNPRPVGEVLAGADLNEIAGRRVGKCSGGEQQRLKFALATINRPQLLFLDEPTAGMDPTARRKFWERMHAQADAGTTILFATHYLEEAEAFAKRIILLHQGGIIIDGTMAQVQAHSTKTTVSFLGDVDPARLPAECGVTAVSRHGARTALVTTASDALARHLLTTTGAHDLTIERSTLEDLFVELTKRDDLTNTANGAGDRASNSEAKGA